MCAASNGPSDPSRVLRCYGPLKLRLTLFLQPNHGFGESFSVPPVVSPPRTIKTSSHTLLEPAGQLAEAFNQRFDPVHLGHPGLDVLEPAQIGVARLVAQCQLGVLQLPK